EVINHTNKHKIGIHFKPAGWFGHDLNRFEGFIYNEKKEKTRFLYGKWNEYLKSANINDYEEYLKANNNKFRVPDKPEDSPPANSTPRKVISKLAKQLTGGSLDFGANESPIETTPKNLPPEDPNG